jgi:hypothetical protein
MMGKILLLVSIKNFLLSTDIIKSAIALSEKVRQRKLNSKGINLEETVRHNKIVDCLKSPSIQTVVSSHETNWFKEQAEILLDRLRSQMGERECSINGPHTHSRYLGTQHYFNT